MQSLAVGDQFLPSLKILAFQRRGQRLLGCPQELRDYAVQGVTQWSAPPAKHPHSGS
jgi:hypothetical protein